MKIGIVAVQGAVSEHFDILKKAMKKLSIDGKIIHVKRVEDLEDISGIVIPGGESTTINKLIESSRPCYIIARIIECTIF